MTVALVARFVDANFIDSPYDKSLSGLMNGAIYTILAGFLISLILTIVSFVYHFWKGKTRDAEILPQEEEYQPPVINTKAESKNKSKKEKSEKISKL